MQYMYLATPTSSKAWVLTFSMHNFKKFLTNNTQLLQSICTVPPGSWKSLNLKGANSRPWKSLKMKVVLEKSFKVTFLENFYWLQVFLNFSPCYYEIWIMLTLLLWKDHLLRNTLKVFSNNTHRFFESILLSKFMFMLPYVCIGKTRILLQFFYLLFCQLPSEGHRTELDHLKPHVFLEMSTIWQCRSKNGMPF